MMDQHPKNENYWDKEFVKVVPSFDDNQAIMKGATMQIMDRFKKKAFEVNANNFRTVLHANFNCKINTNHVCLAFNVT